MSIKVECEYNEIRLLYAKLKPKGKGKQEMGKKLIKKENLAN